MILLSLAFGKWTQCSCCDYTAVVAGYMQATLLEYGSRMEFYFLYRYERLSKTIASPPNEWPCSPRERAG